MEKYNEQELWKLLAKGDPCVVNNAGVIEQGFVSYIARMSSGRVYIKVVGPRGEDLCLVDAADVKPANHEQIIRKMSTFDLLLEKYEPKGMTTASSTYIYD